MRQGVQQLEKITFHPEGEAPVDFFVLEQTRIGGFDYILVTDFEEGDGEALILKDLSQDGEEESLYTIVSEEEELNAVAGVFESMLEDVEFVRDMEERHSAEEKHSGEERHSGE